MNYVSKEWRVKIKRDPREFIIAQMRRQMGWSQEYLAEITGYSKLYILKLEKRRIPNPSIKVFGELSKAFGMSIDSLWKDYQDKK
ncbi:hypothetical protein ES702_01747 [subsurface metagenome]